MLLVPPTAPDLTAGVVATRDPRLAAELAFRRNAEGTALAPFEIWPEDLVRLSAGIEDPDDLLDDLARALAKC